MDHRTLTGVAAGGFAGSVCRYGLSQASMTWGGVSMNILLINLLGAFVLAAFLEMSQERLRISARVRTAVSTGFLGAFTTFSGLCSEAFSLNQTAGTGAAGIYLGLSLVGGVCAAVGGIAAARRLMVRTGE